MQQEEYFTTETQYFFETPPYSDILRLIGNGHENATHKAELLRYTGMTDRDLRKLIERFRRCGIVIISDSNGYYFPKSTDELQQYIKQEERRAKSIFYTLKAARRLLKRSVLND